MKKLVSVLGSIVMGMNVGAVSSSAICVRVRSQANKEAKIFGEIINMNQYRFYPDCIKTEGWTLIGTDKIFRKLARKAIKEIHSLERTVGVSDFKPKAEKYSELRDTLQNALCWGLQRACYVIPDTLKTEGRWPFTKEYYQLFKNEGNVDLVKRNLPEFLKALSAYLDSKESNKKNKLRRNMQALLERLPDLLSELIVAALNIYEINIIKQ